MIHVYFADSYDALQEQLIKNLENDLKGLDLSPENNFPQMFKQFPVICGNYQIQEYLANQLAEKFEIVPGVEFFTLNAWLAKYLQTPLSSEESQKALTWQIWWALECLKDPAQKPQTTFKKNAPKSSERLLGFIQNCNDKALMSFSIKLRQLFTTYATYRLDWLFNWLNPRLNKIEDPQNKDFLENQPDWGWEKELWKILVLPTNSETKKSNSKFDSKPVEIFPGTTEEYKKSIQGCLQKLDDDFSKLGEEHFHFFIPLSLPPMFFRYLEEFGSKAALTFDLFILLPTLALWRNNKPDKSKGNKRQKEPTKLDPYIDSMTFPSQHIIEQVRALKLPSKNIDVLEKDINTNSEKTTNTKKANKEVSETSYLKQLQNAILANDRKQLPTEPQEDDESFKVFKAPSFKRELDAITDWIHFCFNQNKVQEKPDNLKLSDFLIVVPDVNEKVTAIESEMESLPKNMTLSYKVLDKNLTLSNSVIEAIIGLGKLLESPFRKKDFIEWLELPINRSRWKLSLEDVKNISAWLEASGFHKGISTEQLESLGLKGEDYSLESAIERLTFGYFIEQSNEKRGWGDILPISADQENGWKRTSEDQGRVLKSLVELAEYFKLAWRDLKEFKEGTSVEKWIELIDSWLKNFFDVRRPPLELIIFRKKLEESLKAATKAGLIEQECKVPFAAIWRYLEGAIESSIEVEKPFGAISFASASAMIGVPFKAIVFAGLDEPSGFPKKVQYPEYNLMGLEEVKRASDPNSFETDKESFIRLLLNTKQKLVISYSIGYNPLKEIEPSSVIKKLKTFFLSNSSPNKKQTNTKEEIWKSVTENIPLNVFSENNFNNPTTSKRSHREYALDALKESLKKKADQREEPIFNPGYYLAAVNPNYKVEKTINVNDLINFITDPEKFVLKRLQMKRDEEFPEEIFKWFPKSDKLNSKKNFTNIFENLLDEIEKKELKAIKELDPKEGIKEVRQLGEDLSHASVLAAISFLKLKLPSLYESSKAKEKDEKGKKGKDSNNLGTKLNSALKVIRERLDATLNLIDARNAMGKIDYFLNSSPLLNYNRKKPEHHLNLIREFINGKNFLSNNSRPIGFLKKCKTSTLLPLEKETRDKIQSFLENEVETYRLPYSKKYIIENYNGIDTGSKCVETINSHMSSIIAYLNMKGSDKERYILQDLNRNGFIKSSAYETYLNNIRTHFEANTTFSDFSKNFDSFLNNRPKFKLESEIEDLISILKYYRVGLISKEMAQKAFEKLLKLIEKPINLEPFEEFLESVKKIDTSEQINKSDDFSRTLSVIQDEFDKLINNKIELSDLNKAIEILKENFEPPLMLNEAVNAHKLYVSKVDFNKGKHIEPIELDISENTGFEKIKDDLEEPYFIDNKTRIISLGKSRTDRKKALIRHLIWHASGKTNCESFLYHPINQVYEANELSLDHLLPEQTKALVELLVQLYSIGINSALPYSPSDYKNPSFQFMTLWRGRNIGALKFFTRNFMDELNKFSSFESYGRRYAKLLRRLVELLTQLTAI